MTANFYACIHERLLENPGQELLIWPDQHPGGRVYTGQAILDRVAALGNALAAAGVRSGDRVMLALPVSFDLICTLLAIMALGAIPVLPPAAPTLRTLLFLATKGDIRAVVTRQKLSPLSWLARRFGIIPLSTTGIAPPAPWLLPQPVDPDQPALVSHSSGSTGVPKAIRRSHRVLLAQHQALSAAFPPWSGQRDFPLFPNILLHNLAVGTVSILPDLAGGLTQMEPDRLVQQLTGQRVQTLTGNVYYFRKLLDFLQTQAVTFPHVRALGIGGSPVPESLTHSLKRFFVRASIYIIYGSSEAEPIAVRSVGADPWPARLGYAVGLVHPALRVELRPVGLLTFADGTVREVGELTVKGAHVATAGDDWLATGDFGYLDDTGQLVLTGRQGNEGLHQGVQHYQVEHVLTEVVGVKRVAARSTERGFTIYVEGNPTEADLWNALHDNFPGGIVTAIRFRRKLPVDARHQSKIRYHQLT